MQEFNIGLGGFIKASINDGAQEAFEFTDINKSLATRLSLSGGHWNRSDDTIGMATAINALSRVARDYFADGGIGILIGDGRLPHYAWKKIIETYYSMAVLKYLAVSVDFQTVADPAYNRDRGTMYIFWPSPAHRNLIAG